MLQKKGKYIYIRKSKTFRSNYKEEWLNERALGNTGRILLKYMTTPKANDKINKLNKKDKSTIFRQNTAHIVK